VTSGQGQARIPVDWPVSDGSDISGSVREGDQKQHAGTEEFTVTVPIECSKATRLLKAPPNLYVLMVGSVRLVRLVRLGECRSVIGPRNPR